MGVLAFPAQAFASLRCPLEHRWESPLPTCSVSLSLFPRTRGCFVNEFFQVQMLITIPGSRSFCRKPKHRESIHLPRLSWPSMWAVGLRSPRSSV